jgi:anthranilate synthase component 1
VLFLDFSGNLNSCIVIRTVLIKGKTAYLQAGAGIVAISVPARTSFGILHPRHPIRR